MPSSTEVAHTKFEFQKKFAEAVDDDWRTVYEETMPDFHYGWKKITKAPAIGNHNPNYKDMQKLCAAVITARRTDLLLPSFPFEMRIALPLQLRSGVSAWVLVYNIANAWHLLAKKHFRKPQMCGVLQHLVAENALWYFNEKVIIKMADEYYREHCWHLHPAYESAEEE